MIDFDTACDLFDSGLFGSLSGLPEWWAPDYADRFVARIMAELASRGMTC